MDNLITNRAADNIRVLTVAMVEKSKSGHPGGAMGGADFINILYSEFLNFDPEDMENPLRDRFFLDPGHMSPMLYSVLTLTGAYSTNDLKNFRQWKSNTPGHPELDVKRGVENTSGPLGQGHTMAIGAAIAERLLVARFGDCLAHKTYAFISDGGVQEEISQGGGRIAGHLGLSNLIMFFDSNNVQLSTKVDEVTGEDTAAKYRAWGWKVIKIDGNNADEIRGALMMANQETEKPVLIIGETIMGKGCLTQDGLSYEGMVSTHGQPISNAGASAEKTFENLGADPENPFMIFPDVEGYYKEVLKEKSRIMAEKKSRFNHWQEVNSEKALKLDSILKGDIPTIDFERIPIKANSATRSASSLVLSEFSGTIENMVVISADLSNSDKTDGFLKSTKPILRNDFTGAFINAGVSELTMATIANGLALHNIIPVCGTFFVFSDYMKPAVRMAALMGLPVKYVWTHDSFRVGEDGPTHQPVEQEAQIRLMEKIKNHSGENSLMALRPADATETLVAWEMAIENKSTPTALILSRQNIKDIPAKNSCTRFVGALEAKKGAYIAKESEAKADIILVASGSEVATLVEAAEILINENGINARVVSVISEGVFRLQEKTYQNKIIPNDIPVMGLSAGLSVTLEGIVGANGEVIGMDHFGYSAPYTVLDEKLGFSGVEVSKKVLKFLQK